MQFFLNFGKVVCWLPLEVWRPLLLGILDPPLVTDLHSKSLDLRCLPSNFLFPLRLALHGKSWIRRCIGSSNEPPQSWLFEASNLFVRALFSSATKLRRLCFYTCMSVHWGYLGRYPPEPGTPPRTRYTPQSRYTPPEQVHSPGPGTPRIRYTPQVHPPSRRVLLRTVRILLECILVFLRFAEDFLHD